jgi:23S rRNA pseudouridine955/2504/2580 synthase
MGEVKLITVGAAEDGIRLDRWLRRRWPTLGQTQIHKLARGGQLRVDGARVKADSRLAAGAMVRVPPLPEGPPPGSLAPGSFERAPREPVSERDAAFARSLVLFEDEAVLILNKPAGLAVQGGTKTLRHIDRLLGAWGEGPRRPRLVHRLDRDTSGVLALGKTPDAAARLAAAFAQRSARKIYWALVEGGPPDEGTIDLPLAKVGIDDRERMVPVDPGDANGKPAVSEYVVIARAGPRAAWLALEPRTGRTHQLRAHLLAIGHPILGDPKYNTPASAAASGPLKLQLHARRLVIPHPAGGVIDVSAPPGPELQEGFARFGFDPADAPPDPFAANGSLAARRR